MKANSQVKQSQPKKTLPYNGYDQQSPYPGYPSSQDSLFPSSTSIKYQTLQISQMEQQLQPLNHHPEIINSVSFNWDCTCIALATSRGFKVFSTQPLKLKQTRDLAAPLQIVEMVDRSNLLALVGFENSAFQSKRIAIFDDNSNSIIADATFDSHVLAVKIRMKRMVVAVSTRVYLVNFLSMEILHIVPTYRFSQEQPYNLISMSNNPENLLLACPTVELGHILIVHVEEEKQRRIRAHQSILSSIAITLNGDKVATASEKGINIRVFNSATGELLQEVRRGNQYGMIYSLAFSRAGNWLTCTSDSNIVHIFASPPTPQTRERRYVSKVEQVYSNPKSFLYFLRRLLPYFDAEYSYCSYEMTDFESEMITVAAFGFHDDAPMIVNDYDEWGKVQKSAGQLRVDGSPEVISEITGMLQSGCVCSIDY